MSGFQTVLLVLVAPLASCAVEPTSDALRLGGPVESLLEVADGVRVEVLDWGGNGPPLVLLAGARRSAHVYEDLAPLFTDRRTVLGITRRRVGHSDAPEEEFGLADLVNDIIALLDARGFEQADFIGHSFGGAELSYLALHHPERVRRAVFLDGAWDFYEMYNADGWWKPWPDLPMTAADSASPQAVASYFAQSWGALFPLNEIRAIHRFDSMGKLVALDPEVGDMFSGMIRARLTPLDMANISVPVLSVRVVPQRIEDFFLRYSTYGPEDRVLAEQAYQRWMEVVIPESARFVATVPGAQELVLKGANHDVLNVQPERFLPAVRGYLIN